MSIYRQMWTLGLVGALAVAAGPACDDGDDRAGGEGEGQPLNPGAECAYPADCVGGDCSPEGHCVAVPDCADYTQCPADDAVCVEGRCLTRCDSDLDCAQEAHCADGECRPFPFTIDAPPPHPPEADRAPLQAGFGQVDLPMPVGLSMAGYGFRSGPITPYALSMGGSNGFWDKPDVKALVLDNGQERLVILRLPTCWNTDFHRTALVRELERRTSISYEQRIITTSSHTHSYPGRFWNLLTDLGFESFGYGRFSPSHWRNLVTAAADAVELGVAGLRPAAVGHHIERNFDPENHINRDRRGENAPFKDPQMLTLRVDDVSGERPVPMAVVVKFAMHGTIMENSRISGDAGGAVERVAEEELSRQHGADVRVIYANGSAGDVSPDGDGLGHPAPARLELLGHRTTAWIRAGMDAAEMSTDVLLSQSDRRIPITREHIGYDEDEFTKVPESKFDLDAGPYKYGGFQCVRDGFDHSSGETWQDGDLGCLFSVELANSNGPVRQFSKTVLTAARIGPLLILTLPGEPVSQLGAELAEGVASRYGHPDVSVWGYSQDHQLYLTPYEDWFQGGYEAAQGVWGFRFGDYLNREAEEGAGAVIEGATFEPPPAGVHPVWFDDIGDDTVLPVATDGTPGEVHDDVQGALMRFEMTRFSWTGGHPAVDLPRLTVEAKGEDGSFAPLLWPGERPYDDRGFRMVTDYLGDWDTAHSWRVSWEELGDFPAGTYRLRAVGAHWTGTEEEAYEATSSVFSVDPWVGEADSLAWGPGDDELTLDVKYPDAVDGSYRMRSMLVRHPGAGGPDPESLVVAVEAVDAEDGRSTLPAGAVAVATEEGTTRITHPVPVGDNPPVSLVVTVTDAFGNTWTATTEE